jgi:hypothetical protein
METLSYLCNKDCDVIKLVEFLLSKDALIQEEAIKLFLKAGKTEYFTAFLLSGNEEIVKRFKKYLKEE